MRLAVDKWGLIEERSDNPLKEDINTSRNISDVEYEIVRVDVEGKR